MIFFCISFFSIFLFPPKKSLENASTLPTAGGASSSPLSGAGCGHSKLGVSFAPSRPLLRTGVSGGQGRPGSEGTETPSSARMKALIENLLLLPRSGLCPLAPKVLVSASVTGQGGLSSHTPSENTNPKPAGNLPRVWFLQLLSQGTTLPGSSFLFLLPGFLVPGVSLPHPALPLIACRGEGGLGTASLCTQISIFPPAGSMAPGKPLTPWHWAVSCAVC